MVDDDIRRGLADAAPPAARADFDRLWQRGRRQRRQLQVVGGIVAAAALVPVAAFGASAILDRDATTPVIGSGPSDCPVTIPDGDVDPPAPYPSEPAGDGRAWYGNQDLWTVLDTDGDHSPGKSVWWSGHFRGGVDEPTPDIEVTWRRLDWPADAAITVTGGTNAHTAEDGWFMIAGLDPGIGGCWEVTATYRGAELSYVYEYDDALTERLEPIHADQLPTAQLRDLADLQDGDRLYALPLTGDHTDHQVFVRFRDGARTLLFGTACTVVNSVPRPERWDGTCLEPASSDGDRVTGALPHGTVGTVVDHADRRAPSTSAPGWGSSRR